MNDAETRVALLSVALGTPQPVSGPIPAWDSWLWNARFDRVVPLLHHFVAEHPAAVSVEQRAQLHRAQGDAMASAVTVEHHLLEVAGMLESAGIDFAVLKGIATAHLDYPDPTWRQFGDADVLVHPQSLAATRELLERCGWRQGYALPRHHERFTHAVTFVRAGVELDLHQRIGHRALGLAVPTADLLEHRVPFEIAGRRLFALSSADRLIHAAIHERTSRGSTKRLSSVADVAVLAQMHCSDADEILRRAEGWRVRSFVEAAISAAYGAASVAIPHRWVVAMTRPTRSNSMLLDRAYLSGRHRPLLQELAYLKLMDSWTARALYLDGHLRVGPAFAAAHDRHGIRRALHHLWSKSRSGRPT